MQTDFDIEAWDITDIQIPDDLRQPESSGWVSGTVTNVERSSLGTSIETTAGLFNLVGLWAIAPVHTGAPFCISFNFLQGRSQGLSTSVPCVEYPYDLFVLYPLRGVSATSLSTATSCLRKGVFFDRFNDHGGVMSERMVYGTIIHQVIQACLFDDVWDANSIRVKAVRFLLDSAIDIWACNIKLKTALDYILEHLEDINVFRESCFRNASLSSLEEFVGSSYLGFVGYADATLREQDSGDLVPLEIKTGEFQSVAHYAQAMIYAFLLNKMYLNRESNSAVLYYSKNNERKDVVIRPLDIASLVSVRNMWIDYVLIPWHAEAEEAQSGHMADKGEFTDDIDLILAGEIDDFEASDPHKGSHVPTMNPVARLPEPVHDERQCSRCPRLQSCSLFLPEHAIQGGPTKWRELMKAAQNTLTPRERDFFIHWDNALTFEEMYLQSRNGLGIAKYEPTDTGPHSKLLFSLESYDTLRHDFEWEESSVLRLKCLDHSPPVFFEQNQRVIVSIMSPVSRDTWARGFVVDAAPETSTLALSIPGNAYQRLEMLLHRAVGSSAAINLCSFSLRIEENPERFKIDRAHLAHLMAGDDIPTKLRSLIIDQHAPQFASCDSSTLPTSTHFNEQQSKAIDVALRAQDFALIHGMPGTGKTTVIMELVSQYMAAGKTVLVSANTHSAVDNIFLGLYRKFPELLLRVGPLSKISKALHSCALESFQIHQMNQDYLDKFLSRPVVGVTCMGTMSSIFSRRSDFDLCIVDEGSMVTLPTILGPLLHAKKFVLVGDPDQLPPIVNSRKAKDAGLDKSLFLMLQQTHPQAVVRLTHQYRMLPEIMTLSNALSYEGRLVFGGDEEHFKSRISEKISPHVQLADLYAMVLETLQNPVTFIDTDSASSLESVTETRLSDSILNHFEAACVVNLALGLVSVFGKHEIGIITTYKAQQDLVKSILQDVGLSEADVWTVDQSQGREKDCIIMSFVRCNTQLSIGDILKDPRRVTVALTRSRERLVLVGSKSTLSPVPSLSSLLSLVAAEGGMFYFQV